jgi:hypothetical protein
VTADLKPDASISAAALRLLLATHPELVELPVEWAIDLERVIRPSITVRHPDGERAARLIAAALELEPVEGRVFSDGGKPTRSLYVDGRWGGACWSFTAYVTATPEPEVVL